MSVADAIVSEGGAQELPPVLLPYQQQGVDLLLSGVSVLVVEKSRRIGFTWGLAAYAVLRASLAKPEGGMDVMYISYAQDMTREFVDACAMWAKAFAIAAMGQEEFLFDDANPDDPANTRQIQAFRIRFASGFDIVALSSAPRSLRGKQGCVIVDEAAFVDSLAELLKAAMAFLMWGGQVVVVSTHNGNENPFNGLVQDVVSGRKPYQHMRIDLDDALKDGLYKRIAFVTGKTWSSEAEGKWRSDLIASYGDDAQEELFCVPAQGNGLFLPSSLIEARMIPDLAIVRFDAGDDFLSLSQQLRDQKMAALREEIDAVLKQLDPTEPHSFGFDFARHVDLSVGSVFATSKNLKRVATLTLEMRRTPHAEQAEIVLYILKRLPRLIGAWFDATGAGEYVAEQALRVHGEVVQAIKLSVDWYRVNMPPFKKAFEDNEIGIPKDEEILSDLRLLRSIKGVGRVPDMRTGEKQNRRHGDAAISYALGFGASRGDPPTYAYTPAQDWDQGFSLFDDASGGRTLW